MGRIAQRTFILEYLPFKARRLCSAGTVKASKADWKLGLISQRILKDDIFGALIFESGMFARVADEARCLADRQQVILAYKLTPFPQS